MQKLIKGLGWAFKLLFFGAIIAVAAFFYLRAGERTDKDLEDPQSDSGAQDKSGNWRPLQPSGRGADEDDSGFLSEVTIQQKGEFLNYRIVIGPYDPKITRSLKRSGGWVTLMLELPSGEPVPTIASGIKIETKDFDELAPHGTPVGWVHAGQLHVDGVGDVAEQFSLGWVLPEGVRPGAPATPVDNRARGVDRF